MPNRKDGRIEKGQKLATAISARAWNRSQQAADVVLGAQPGAGVPAGQAVPLPYNWVYVKMNMDVDAGDAVSILGFADALSNANEYVMGDSQRLQSMPVMLGTGGTGSWAYIDNLQHFGIAVEPINTNSVGRVAVAGVVACNVYCLKAWHAYAIPRSDHKQLVSSHLGHIQILAWYPQLSLSDVANEFPVSAPLTKNIDINRLCTALVRIGTMPPTQCVIVEVPNGWTVGQTREVLILGGGDAGGASQFTTPQQLEGGKIPVTNILCDIRYAGKGFALSYGNRWLLASWTPVEVDGLNGDSYFVHSTK